MNKPYHVIKTEKLPLTDTPAEILSLGTAVRLFGDRSFHFAVGGSPATSNDTPTSADHPEYISGGAKSDKLTFVKAAGETDGSVWVSFIQFS